MGKGDSPPAPDPAIGEAARANSAIGREALDFSKTQYADAKARNAEFDPLVKQIGQQQLDIGNKQSAQADDYTNYMKTVFRPIETSLADEANSFDTEGKRNELAGKAAADVEQAAGTSDDNARRMAATYGINVNDGAFSSQLAGNELNKTLAKVGAMNNARTQARAEGRAFKFDVAGLGRGLPGAGATAAGVALNAGNAAANNSAMVPANARADAGTMMTGFNTATGANTAAGGLYSNVFGAEMQGYQAQQQALGGTMQGLGTAAGMIGAAYLAPPAGAAAAFT
jgi:hypothetical protein